MKKPEPGMGIFLKTGIGEPTTIVKHLMSTDGAHFSELELIQLAKFGDAMSVAALNTNA